MLKKVKTFLALPMPAWNLLTISVRLKAPDWFNRCSCRKSLPEQGGGSIDNAWDSAQGCNSDGAVLSKVRSDLRQIVISVLHETM